MSASFTISAFVEANKSELGQFSADYASGTTIQITNTNGFAVDEYAVFGKDGYETSEVRRITAKSATTLTIASALTYPHKQYEPITQLRGSQFKVYTAAFANGSCPLATGSYSYLASSVTDLHVDQMETPFTDAAGSSTVCYRITFFNPTTLAETDLAASPPIQGSAAHLTTIERIRIAASFVNAKNITNLTIQNRRAEAESFVLGALASAHYTLPLSITPPAITHIATELAAAFLRLNDDPQRNEFTTQFWKDRKEHALGMLQFFIDSKIQLVDPDTQTSLNRNAGISGQPNDGDFLFTIDQVL